jgi:NADH-quinone oxidoreductase subunit E
MLTNAEREAIEKEVAQYPDRRAACIDALVRLQESRGWISDETLRELGPVLGMSPEELEGVATFYNRILRRPVGRHLVWLCNSASCWLMGADAVRRAFERRLGISLGETTRDGRFTLLPTVCLGACDHAPAVMVDDALFPDLDPQQIDETLVRAALLTKAERQAVDEETSPYPDRRAACIDALILLQKRRGWISNQTLEALGPVLDMTADELEGVATFYNRILRRAVGRHVIWICDSASCWIMGYEGLRLALERHLGVSLGETTPDGRFTLLPTVCLGACNHAPVLMVDDDLHRDLNPDRLQEVLAAYE